MSILGGENTRCPRCGRRIGFNERSNTCQKCGAWLLSRPPSEHALQHMQREGTKDGFLDDFPWIGGTPGARAVKFTAIWVALLVAFSVLTLVCLVTLHFILAGVFIALIVATAILPQLFLVGSRI